MLDLLPFDGDYITLKEFHGKTLLSWPGWEPTVDGLGCTFLEGLFDPRCREYPELKFNLIKRVPKNILLLDKFSSTKLRMLS